MRPTTLGARIAAALLVAIMGAVIWVAPAAAVVVTKTTGVVAPWETTDNATHPGGHCRYEGAAGSFFLRSIRGNAVGIEGIETELRSVGYRLLLQHATAHGWRTTQRGTLFTSAASQTHTAVLHKSRILRDPDASPNTGRYRLAIKVVWYDESAHVQGTQTAYIEHHSRSTNGSVGSSCRARFPTS